MHSRFLTHAVSLSSLPPMIVPEIAFWGRSNVGKSSLLNSLFHGSLARTSKRPGCTQGLNFYSISSYMRLVDLPGYGYAQVPVALCRQWTVLVENYLAIRSSLWRIYLLIDSRHSLQPLDYEKIHFIQSLKKPFTCILTKVDSISFSLLEKRKEEFSHVFPSLSLLAVSGKKGYGISILKQELQALAPC